MAQILQPGPYKLIDVDGVVAPWYIIPFDKSGQCTGPLTRQALVDASTSGDFTDIFIFSHGWNNDWTVASARYDDFIQHYKNLRNQEELAYGRPHRPLLVGIFWPSTALIAPWEEGPQFAVGSPNLQDIQVAQSQQDTVELGEEVNPGQRPRFYELVQLDRALLPTELTELAALLAPVWERFQNNDTNDLPAHSRTVAPQALVEIWQGLQKASTDVDADDDSDEWGYALDPAAQPESASLLDIFLKPRDVLRAFTVLQMKDRAATVGAYGVAPLLRDLLMASKTARVHMIGHSYGCIVVLSAVCYPPHPDLPRVVDSLLLLQPAVSCWCFAENVAGKGYTGGFRVALKRVKQPILTTFSKNDWPLTKFFHWAVRRDRDLGQPAILAPGVPQIPSKHAALGGFGPTGCSETECKFIPIHTVGTEYPLGSDAPRIYALRSDNAIAGHGDIDVPETWWALFNQVRTVS